MGVCAVKYNNVCKHPFLLCIIKSVHITFSVSFTGASLSGCVVVDRGGCRGMIEGSYAGSLFLFGGGCTKSLLSVRYEFSKGVNRSSWQGPSLVNVIFLCFLSLCRMV
jgi:hypothetical protein